MVGSVHGQFTFRRSHRLARGKTFESLGTQEGGVVPAADSRCPGREQRGREPMDEAGTPRRGRGTKAPDRPRSYSAPERKAAPEAARASGAGSRGARFPGGGVDVFEGGYAHPKRVRSRLPPVSREPPTQSSRAKPAEAGAPGEPAGRAGRRALERAEVALPEKSALKEGRTIVFRDQSGFHLSPMVVRTYAPVGRTPVLHELLGRDHLSAMSGITLEGKLYMLEQERAFKGEDVVRFLKHLMRQIEGKLLVIWDGAPIHHGRAVKDFLASGAARRVQLERLPGCAPDLNPDEGIWKHLKYVELKNLCCESLAELKIELRKAKERLRHKRDVILGCIRQPGFEV